MAKTMRVGICGAEPAGLTLAAILSREAEAGAFELKVFERGEAQRDQGSGWDMSKAALEALSRAGVEPSTVQRQDSDTMRFYRTGGSRPDVCLRLPSYLKRWGVKKEDVGLDQMNLETERNLIISGLMAQLGSEVAVQHNTNVCAVRRKGDGVELLGETWVRISTSNKAFPAADLVQIAAVVGQIVDLMLVVHPRSDASSNLHRVPFLVPIVVTSIHW